MILNQFVKMKHLLYPFIYGILLLIVQSCDNAPNVPYGFEWANFSKGDICVYIKYKQQVNGYDVSAICLVDTAHNGEFYTYYNPTSINGRGFIHFQNDEQEFIVENPLFSDINLSHNKLPLKNGILIETDYTPFKVANDTLNNMLFNASESPFFFFDIDFDGETELIITLVEGMCYHGHNAYKSYKIPMMENECLVLSPMHGEPFEKLNDYTEIDTVKKEIRQPYDTGIRLGGKKKYGLVTHTVFNEIIQELEKRQYMELKEIEHYDWCHTEVLEFKTCAPAIYHYKKVNGDIKLINIEKLK